MLMKKIVEIVYPYVVSLVVLFLFIKFDKNLYQSTNINSALEAVITVSSLIIGFLGAILPIIMSMKNDSKLVKYVFERDKDRLFLKYIKQTLIVGILVIVFAVTIYFRYQYAGTWYEARCISILAYVLSCFLLCTYRCLSNMLNLIFTKDTDLQTAKESFSNKTLREIEFEKKCISTEDEINREED